MALWQRSPDHARGRSAVPFCVSYLWMMSTAFRINRKRPPTKVSGLLVVEVTRLELAASASRTQRSTKLSHTSMAARLGFEPRQTESESVVLPLHNRALFFVLCFVTNSIIPRKKKKSIAFPHIFAKNSIFFSDTAHIALNLLRLIALE